MLVSLYSVGRSKSPRAAGERSLLLYCHPFLCLHEATLQVLHNRLEARAGTQSLGKKYGFVVGEEPVFLSLEKGTYSSPHIAYLLLKAEQRAYYWCLFMAPGKCGSRGCNPMHSLTSCYTWRPNIAFIIVWRKM